jgi:hypothetical protein
MRKTTTSFALAIIGATCILSVPASAAPNQGDATKVTTVTNPAISCSAPVAETKVEGGGMGTTITVTTTNPVAFVTVKSGSSAILVSSTFTDTGATITMSKDVSNYIVWTCTSGGVF